MAVVVTHDPRADRLDRLVSALAGQDHPNLAVLVVDTGTEDPTERVHAALPPARVVRVGDVGFGAAANTVLDLVSGAEYYLFCHDDVAPDRRTVSALPLVAPFARWVITDLYPPKRDSNVPAARLGGRLLGWALVGRVGGGLVGLGRRVPAGDQVAGRAGLVEPAHRGRHRRLV